MNINYENNRALETIGMLLSIFKYELSENDETFNNSKDIDVDKGMEILDDVISDFIEIAKKENIDVISNMLHDFIKSEMLMLMDIQNISSSLQHIVDKNDALIDSETEEDKA
jgi:hypothetical protein